MSFISSVMSYWNKKRDESVSQMIETNNVNIIKVDQDGTVTVASCEDPKPKVTYTPSYGPLGLVCHGNQMDECEVGYEMKATLLNKDYVKPFGDAPVDERVKTVIVYKDGKEIPIRYADGKIDLVDDYDFPMVITARLLI